MVIGEQIPLVLEGGGLRGAFTSGILEYFLDHDLAFQRVIGVSAGACVGASYLSGQKGRNLLVNVEFPSDPRYMGYRHLLTKGNYFNMDFIFGELPHNLVPFDEEAFDRNPAAFEVVATSLESGQAIVFDRMDFQRTGLEKALVASSSIPLLSKAVEINGRRYFDGGVADSIPVTYALERGRKAVVVLTQPRGYRKHPMKNTLLLRLKYGKHPEFLKVLLHRNEDYNQALATCEGLEQEGRIFVLAPSQEFVIGRAEKEKQKRLRLYNHGYELMRQQAEKLIHFLQA
ncbi:MAG: patatin family protein [Marinilabiliales bacterium]|nr:patatin family protein [Marinilabiliales bacterium]